MWEFVYDDEEEPLRGHFGRYVQACREARGLTREQLADRCELVLDMIVRLEEGYLSPEFDTLRKLCAGLGMSMSALAQSSLGRGQSARFFGLYIRSCRDERDLSVADLARRCNLSVESIEEIENGRVSMALDTLRKLCLGLDIPLSELFDGFERVP
ncbi:anaerobic benzoate catabolism transcriptional regulator [Enhygromyxa salina]|uniref:Anaerobic benzoate catabolism transcriptional regulator n=1 Tax=Enhygromyxa salina TaxID=215803 RepID=A0A2S9YEA3_9BACT|nr:helix-turn-helix transcriptional regulator [Enhygromyxa salina]PRQ03346.1 anaerobic benzoate catabolism transcriptional regulator [Enhygromyxa salina]